MRSLPLAHLPLAILLILCGAAPACENGGSGQRDAAVTVDVLADSLPPAPDGQPQPFDTEAELPAPEVGPQDASPDTDTTPPDGDVTTDSPADTGPDVPPGPGVVARSCVHTFRYSPPGAPPQSVTVAGGFNGWSATAMPMSAGPDGEWTAELDLAELSPGAYGYKFVVDGASEWILDPTNMMKRFDDGGLNSKLLVPDCTRPALKLVERTVDSVGGSATIEVAVEHGVGSELDSPSPRVTWNFDPYPGAWDAQRGTLRVVRTGLPPGKHTFRFDADGPTGAAEPMAVSLWVEAQPFEWQDAVLYFAFTDRFRDGDPTVGPSDCLPADSPSNWFGGDWLGIRDAIEEGYFDTLGVSTIWINAPVNNPEACDGGLFGRTYTAYHAYFPVDFDEPEEHFGTLADLRTMVAAAHKRGIRVIADLVINHVYDTAPEWTQHKSDGWFHLPADDGSHLCRNQDWAFPETCWFEEYLPDLAHENDLVVERIAEVAVKWALDADLDGYRVDAVKHVHKNLLHTLRARFDGLEAGAAMPFWTVGETFTGGWGGGEGSEETLIKSYVADDQLYGQFDFPRFWPLLGALATEDTSMAYLGEVTVASADYYGDGAIMSSFLGNHDLARFISVAAGNIPGSCPGQPDSVVPWDCPPAQPSDDEPYQRLERAFTYLAGAPGVPLIYYGDEIGLAGAGDPDNRRPMPWAELAPRQVQLRERVGKLMRARAGCVALRRGGVAIAQSSDDHLIMVRQAGASYAVVAINRSFSPVSAKVSAPPGLQLIDAVSGATLATTSGTTTVQVEARSARLLHTLP